MDISIILHLMLAAEVWLESWCAQAVAQDIHWVLLIRLDVFTDQFKKRSFIEMDITWPEHLSTFDIVLDTVFFRESIHLLI